MNEPIHITIPGDAADPRLQMEAPLYRVIEEFERLDQRGRT
jgi:hypothetical protein